MDRHLGIVHGVSGLSLHPRLLFSFQDCHQRLPHLLKRNTAIHHSHSHPLHLHNRRPGLHVRADLPLPLRDLHQRKLAQPKKQRLRHSRRLRPTEQQSLEQSEQLLRH